MEKIQNNLKKVNMPEILLGLLDVPGLKWDQLGEMKKILNENFEKLNEENFLINNEENPEEFFLKNLEGDFFIEFEKFSYLYKDKKAFLIYKNQKIKLDKKSLAEQIEKLETKYEKSKKSKWYNIANKANTIINKSGTNALCYPASYGIGLEYLINPRFSQDVAKIKEILEKENLEYSNEYSDKFWIFRFKLNKKQINNLF